MSEVGPLDTPALEIARDMARRSLWLAPIVITACAIGWGGGGAASGAFALGIVALNFLLAAWMLTAARRISPAAMAGAAMFGYLIRLGLIWGAVAAVRHLSWVEVVPLGATLIITHLALLMWEVRYVSGSYAYPGLKPTADPSVDRPASLA